MLPDHVPVLVVGGGGTGLSASIFLADHRVEHLLVERHPSTSQLPKARLVNQRTMEIFRQHGIAEDIYEVGFPVENFGKIQWKTSLGGDGPLDRRMIDEIDAFGGGALREMYEQDSPCMPSSYPQIRLEPLLRRHAETRSPGRICFHHELVGFEQDADGVLAQVLDRDSGRTQQVRAQYLVAADGGKTVGSRLGIGMSGSTGLVDMVTAHFRADLSRWWDEECGILFFQNPSATGSWEGGALVPKGPSWGAKSEEWVLHFAFGLNDPSRFEEHSVAPRLRELMKLPHLDIEVLQVSHWIVERVVAQQYQAGRAFLAGDAAHRHPPTTGLGLNTGIQDSHNLAWKLALVLNGTASPQLLQTYAAERRPVGEFNADWALLTWVNRHVVDAGMGLRLGITTEERIATFERFFADSPMGETLRARARATTATQALEYQAHDIEIGFSYPEGAVLPDGAPPPSRDPWGKNYQPTTRPGHRLPHTWLEHDGSTVSTHDLIGTCTGFVLITGPDCEPWTRAVCQLATNGIPAAVTVIPVGPGARYQDPQNNWTTLREVSDQGAVLVRPDNHIAWRSQDTPADPAAALADVFGHVLGTRSPTPTTSLEKS